ncbi:Olfactory receptor 7A17 [Sciurus carolinensis]|uniref:Olfactory receptor 7A17 n=1 Tax=Sciurus carolinensis TaxID=30640 RepID=A0AA41N6L6_SCICA|nr:Olfactory receptor 7A17 [Sciurus carolinensis]
MESENQTGTIEFLLLGLSEDPELQSALLGLFLSMYQVTVLGNLLIILAVSSDPHLHTPMYLFLSNLSFTDISFISTTVPKMLMNIQRQTMAYDRNVVICHPLRYSVIMNPRLCVLLMVLTLTISVVYGRLHSLMVLRLSFCTDLEIPHFFCELDQVIKLSCSATLINNILFYLVSSIVGGVPILGIIYSYIKIVSSILKMSSAGGRHKAFSTCGSHLSVVSLFYGTGFGVYISSVVTDSSTNSAAASVMYTVVPPMLYPFIYSLRNRDMKEALRDLMIKLLFW